MKVLTTTLIAGILFFVAECSSVRAEENKKIERSNMNEKIIDQLLQLETDFQQAIIKNDPEAIGRFIVDDWVIVDAEGHIIDKDKFLAVIKSGALTHDAMKLEEPRVRLYGDTAVVTGVASSTGKYMGAPFTTRERSTDVFVKFEDRWRCVLTQLTRLDDNKTD